MSDADPLDDSADNGDERPPLTKSLKDATGTGTAVLKSLMLVPALVLSPVLGILPKSWKVYHKLHKWTGYQMQKAASADALANVRLRNGQEDVRPAAFVEPDEDEKDLAGWKVKGLGGKRYDPAVHGRSASRFGKANMIHVNEDSTEQGSWAEAAIDNALQLNREKYLFRSAHVHANNLTIDSDGTPQAVADGGQQPATSVTVQQPGVLEDALVPVSSRAGYDGQVISWNQYSTLKNEQTDQEKIRDAKNQAWAAAKLDDIEGADVFKWILIAVGVGAVLLFHQEIGAFIAGLSGGGSGGGAVGSALGMLAMWARPALEER